MYTINMFGYINVNKAELKVKEYYEFRAFYCGLCHTLLRKFGPAGQLSLSYDLTFLAILHTSLYEPDIELEKSSCIVHPIGKKPFVISPYMDYAADMNMLLAMEHFKDDWIDDRKPAAKAAYETYRGKCRKIHAMYPRQWTAIENELRIIGKYEKAGSQDAEAVAACFGRLFGEVFVCKDDAFKSILRNMGFYLGEFIYLMDAYEDLQEDIKKGDYNPFKKMYNISGFDDKVENMLTLAMSRCTDEFEKLPLERDVGILKNILYSGVWSHFNMIKEKRQIERK